MHSRGIRWDPKWTPAVFVAGSAVFGLLALGAVHQYADSPVAVARAFLGCCRSREFDRLRLLFDADYQKALTPGESRDLLQRLHYFVPRSYSITMHDYANADGVVTNWQRYYVRCQIEEPPGAKQGHKCFVVALARQQDGTWRVSFGPTYRSLFAGLYDSMGEPYLLDSMHKAIGARADLLWATRGRSPVRLWESRWLGQVGASQ